MRIHVLLDATGARPRPLRTGPPGPVASLGLDGLAVRAGTDAVTRA
ncbi:hypothetical protein ACIRTB_12745 [Streptomyces sp. NPDC101158]